MVIIKRFETREQIKRFIRIIIAQSTFIGLFILVAILLLYRANIRTAIFIGILVSLAVSIIYGYGVFAFVMIIDWYRRKPEEFPECRKAVWLPIMLVYRNGIDMYYANVVKPAAEKGNNTDSSSK